ncbi:hypothetical protein BKA63DRAFT_563829 [Paraphoma chrysanthemicola]|nr:hypothetical protein BKA63DRAFT_563829 [Paraphoma chrysanthemicola]
MSGELQTIPARHGVATFVPRGRTIKVINTYGKQVVSMWAFSLGPPPEEEDAEEEGEVDEEKVKEEAEGLKNAVEGKGGEEEAEKATEKPEEAEEAEGSGQKETESTSKEADDSKQDDDDPPEQAPDTPENEKTSESSSKQPAKRTWGSYLPSIPYRNKGTPKKPEDQKASAEEEKTQNDANTKKWSSYLPTGKGFSSYVPNVQIPDSKTAVSAFKSSHYRDPNKSYAEQLYDFSKTPVGAGTIAAATGSGYASSVYAVYSAYASTHPSNSSQPPMEYLSLPHTRASSHKLVPEVDDGLLTNLRNPIITLVEDTTPGAHDTLTAACDANLYTALGVDKPEEHGSCAENLVLALKELNEGAGLKGAKAIGADITVNIAPTPLHLFMNAPLDASSIDKTDGAGAKGAVLKVEEPKGKKRSFVRFRADRDVVVVFSACPMDVGSQNGGRCMAANFMVEDVQEGEDFAASVSSLKNKKAAPRKINGDAKKAETKQESVEEKSEAKKEEAKDIEQPKKDAEEAVEEPKKGAEEKKPVARRESNTPKAPPKKLERKPSEKPQAKKEDAAKEESIKEEPKADDAKNEDAKPKKKPKKLQVRGGGTPTPTKSS